MLVEVNFSHSEAVYYHWMKEDNLLCDGSSFSGTNSSMLLIYKAIQGEYQSGQPRLSSVV